MLFWMLAGLIVYLVNVYLPAVLFLPAEGLGRHLGSRDNLPEPNVLVGRARRALSNMQENFPIFVALGLLAFVVEGTDMAQAILGAQIFVIGRAAYIAMYLISVPGLRSAAFTIGLIGNIIQVMALV